MITPEAELPRSSGAMSTSSSSGMQFWLKRLFAFAVDVGLTFGLSIGLTALAGFPVRHFFLRWTGLPTPDKLLMYSLVLAASWVIYRGASESGGRTLGKWLAGLEVEGPEGDPGVARALARALTCVPNALAEALGRHAPFDTLLGVTVRSSPGLLSRNRWRGLGALCVWGGLTGLSLSYGLRPTFPDLSARFYDTGCRDWCWMDLPDADHLHLKARWLSLNPLCEGMAEDFIRLKQQGDPDAILFLETCQSARSMEHAMGAKP